MRLAMQLAMIARVARNGRATHLPIDKPGNVATFSRESLDV